MFLKRLLITTTALVAGTAAVLAADLPRKDVTYPPVVETWNPWMVRVRGIVVMPQESAKLKINGIATPGDVDISTSVVPELDITYFFTKNIAAELILGTTPHNVKAAGALKDVGKIGSVWLLPPTLTLQYHFDVTPNFKPYIGAGVNYTFFYNEDSKGLFDDFSLKNKFGWALQAGADFMIDRHWGVNIDVKKIFLKPDVRATLLTGDVVTGKVKIDPWLFGVGVTYRF